MANRGICVCSMNICFFQFSYSAPLEEYPAAINVRRKNYFLIDSAEDLYGACSWFTAPCRTLLMMSLPHTPVSPPLSPPVTLFNCSVGRSDCSRCRTADPKYGCVWCGGAAGARCVFRDSCSEEVKHTCPAPVIHYVRVKGGGTKRK